MIFRDRACVWELLGNEFFDGLENAEKYRFYYHPAITFLQQLSIVPLSMGSRCARYSS